MKSAKEIFNYTFESKSAELSCLFYAAFARRTLSSGIPVLRYSPAHPQVPVHPSYSGKIGWRVYRL